MNREQKDEFIKRINSVEQNDKASFGKLNVNQMICHCADQLRMAFGEVEGLYRQSIDMTHIISLIAQGETVPTVDGLDQLAGQGTKPTSLENDKAILIDYIEKFVSSGDDYPFHFHPYIGEMNKEKWERLVIQHLAHHLKQFGR
jgi:hypothetical protein